MHWNEKIDLIKRRYSDDEFSVPHVKRKEVLRKIESKFIKRSKEYYDLNSKNIRFSDWWEYLDSTKELVIQLEVKDLLKQIIKPNQKYWIACEFPDQVLIYKSNLPAAIDLVSNGLAWTKTFHIIEQKYEFLLGLKLEEDKTTIKQVGNYKEFERNQ